MYLNHGTKSSRGVPIAFRNELEDKIHSEMSDTKWRQVNMKIEI